MATRQLELALTSSLTEKLLKRLEKVALANAKQTCPVASGDLLNSLYVSRTAKGVTLGSPLEYAEQIENGRPQIDVSGTYVSKVKRHKRRTKRGKVTVRAHTKTFQNMKPVLISGDESGEDTEGVGQSTRANQVWRTLSSSPGTEGTQFMQKALDYARTEVIGDHVEEFKRALKSVGVRSR